jgi:hypothetical protein
VLVLEGVEFLGEGFHLHAFDGVVQQDVLLLDEVAHDFVAIAVLSQVL